MTPPSPPRAARSGPATQAIAADQQRRRRGWSSQWWTPPGRRASRVGLSQRKKVSRVGGQVDQGGWGCGPLGERRGRRPRDQASSSTVFVLCWVEVRAGVVVDTHARSATARLRGPSSASVWSGREFSGRGAWRRVVHGPGPGKGSPEGSIGPAWQPTWAPGGWGGFEAERQAAMVTGNGSADRTGPQPPTKRRTSGFRFTGEVVAL